MCGRLSNPENGGVSQQMPRVVGSVAVYVCRRGFRLVGNSRRVCQPDGRYSGTAPTCEGEYQLVEITCILCLCELLQPLNVESSVILRMVLYLSRHHELWALWQFTNAGEDLYLLVTADECVNQMVLTP